MLSERTKRIMKIAFADNRAPDEMVSILDIVPVVGVKASFDDVLTESEEIPAEKATFTGQVAGMTTDVTIDADVAGVAGNVTITGDGVSDIVTLVDAHNVAFPANTLSITAGNGGQIPDNLEEITLAGGSDLVPEVTFTLTVEADTSGVAGNVTITGDGVSDCATLIGAGYTITSGGANIPLLGEEIVIAGGVDEVLAGGTLSKRTKDIVKIGFCDKRASDEFISLIEAGTGTMSLRTRSILKTCICDNRASNELIALF